MFDLGSPLGWDETFKDNDREQEKFIISLELNTYNDFQSYEYQDMLHALCLEIKIREEKEESAKRKE
jgi:hypothetical protein